MARHTNPRIPLWRFVMGTVGVLLVAGGSLLGAWLLVTYSSGDYGAQGAGFAAGVAILSIIVGILFVLAAFLPVRTFPAILAAVGSAIVAGGVSASLGFVALAIALGAGVLAFYVTYRVAR
jgi:hypothetical protein